MMSPKTVAVFCGAVCVAMVGARVNAVDVVLDHNSDGLEEAATKTCADSPEESCTGTACPCQPAIDYATDEGIRQGWYNQINPDISPDSSDCEFWQMLFVCDSPCKYKGVKFCPLPPCSGATAGGKKCGCDNGCSLCASEECSGSLASCHLNVWGSCRTGQHATCQDYLDDPQNPYRWEKSRGCPVNQYRDPDIPNPSLKQCDGDTGTPCETTCCVSLVTCPAVGSIDNSDSTLPADKTVGARSSVDCYKGFTGSGPATCTLAAGGGSATWVYTPCTENPVPCTVADDCNNHADSVTGNKGGCTCKCATGYTGPACADDGPVHCPGSNIMTKCSGNQCCPGYPAKNGGKKKSFPCPTADPTWCGCDACPDGTACPTDGAACPTV